MKINRTTANKIMSRAIHSQDYCLIGILDEAENLSCAYTIEEVKQLLNNNPGTILIYNQTPEAMEIKENIEYADQQKYIEVFQDTEGVFGLRAFQQIGKIHTPVVLELRD